MRLNSSNAFECFLELTGELHLLGRKADCVVWKSTASVSFCDDKIFKECDQCHVWVNSLVERVFSLKRGGMDLGFRF